ncbi:MAG TPA: OFA family MFS transporter [bacterium]|nr:OFA family MFS transporter [bacterium]
MSQQNPGNRWLIAIMGTTLQLVLGTVYAWSFFQKPIMAAYGWNNVQVMWIFSIAICFLGIGATIGGLNLAKFGPRKLATTGAIMWGAGWLIGAFAMSIQNLPLFYLGYGVIGGLGLGLGYVTPVATAAKWFPDRKGFITGMVVMGFGLGALLMSKVVAPLIMGSVNNDLPTAFLYIGIVLLAMGIPAGLIMKNPPAGFVPAGWTPPATTAASQGHQDDLTVKTCITSSKFIRMWIIFFLNIAAGIMFIGLQSPMLQDLLKIGDPAMEVAALAAAGATLIGISSLFNGIGRFFWGGLSDKIGRVQAFRLILGSQLIVFLTLTVVTNPWIFGALVCYVLLCYGGGFGTMPSFVLDVFHARLMPIVYGIILTAWSTAGIVGPQIAAYLKDNFGAQASTYTFIAGAIMLGTGLLVAFTLNNKSITDKS